MNPRAACSLVILCAAACGAPEGETPSVAVDAGDADLLDRIGYVETSAERADDSRSGVRTFDAARVSPGYDFYVLRDRCMALLEDLDGRIVHEWRSPDPCRGAMWDHGDVLPNGDLIVWGNGGLDRLDWEGNALWESSQIREVNRSAHHDVDPLDSGDLLTLRVMRKSDPGFRNGTQFRDTPIVRLSADGEVLDEFSLFDALFRNNVDYRVTEPVWEGKQIDDLLHTNSIEVMRRPELAARHRIYELGNVLVSMRWQNAIAILDPEKRELLWAWGPGELEGQHDASILANGNILLFDNGTIREWSRVLEIDPLKKEIVWSYGAAAGSDRFYSLSRGGAQRLPNGNTLVTISNEGTAREVTRDGRVVWEWRNPTLSQERRRFTIYRMVRYPPEWIEPLLVSGPPPRP